MQVEYEARPKARSRVNWRLTLFLLVVCVPFVWFFATFVQEARSGGIQNHGDYVSVSLKPLGQYPLDQDRGLFTDIPKRYRELDGKRVALDGFMYFGTSAGTRVDRCQLVWNITKCCFNGPPLVQERVFLQAPPGGKIKMYDYGTLVRVTGKLHVALERNDQGTITSVYEMVPESVTPL